MPIQAPNFAEAREFVEFITGQKDPVLTFQVFDDKAERFGIAEWYHGKLSDSKLCAALTAKAAQGCGVFFTLNECDGHGRRRENVKSYRVSGVDFDGAPLPQVHEFDAVVESSPGKYHGYFLLKPGTDLALWSDTQAQLAAYFGGDARVFDPPRVFRLPGFYHQKGKPFRSRVIHYEQFGDRSTLEQIRADYPAEYKKPGERAGPGAKGQWSPDDNERDIADARRIMAKTIPAEGDRNNTAYRLAAMLNDRAITLETATELLTEWNDDNFVGLPEGEISHVLNSAPNYKSSPAGSRTNPDAMAEFTSAPDFETLQNMERGTVAAPKSKTKAKRPGIQLVQASDVKPEAITYIWKNRLARGMHTAIAGVGGKGKSQLAYAIIAAITKGGPWPDGEGNAPLGRCVILSAEEGKKDMIVPRLIAAGADLTRVHIVDSVVTAEGERKFNLQEDLAALKRICRELKDVTLISIDPVSSYMGGDVDTHRNSAVRTVLDPITKVAEEIDCAILSITHFNKNTSQRAVNRVMESAAFTNAPRAAFAVLEDPDDEVNGRLFLMLKTNMGRPPIGLRFHIDEVATVPDHRDGQMIHAPKLTWDGTTDLTADEATAQLNAGDPEDESPKLFAATNFLLEQLADGPKASNVIYEIGRSAGHTKDSIKRAAKDMGISKRPGGMGRAWVWELADSAVAEFAHAHGVEWP